jgi:hypothetical protein
MPAPPRPDPPAHVARVAVTGDQGATKFANIFWIRNGGGTTPALSDLSAYAGLVYAAYATRFKALINNNTIIRKADLLYYGPAGLVIGGAHVENTSCTRTGTAMPANACPCISWSVQQRYKGGHPRTYLPSPETSDMVDMTSWTTAFTSAAQTAANNFLSDINALTQGAFTDSHLGVVSFVDNKQWRSPPVFRDFTPTAAAVDSRIDSQRRRLGRDR